MFYNRLLQVSKAGCLFVLKGFDIYSLTEYTSIFETKDYIFGTYYLSIKLQIFSLIVMYIVVARFAYKSVVIY